MEELKGSQDKYQCLNIDVRHVVQIPRILRICQFDQEESMCDTIFALGEERSYYLECPSKWALYVSPTEMSKV